jgi:excisionase family DNA binding protein
VSDLSFSLPEAVVEQLVEQVAERVLERLADHDGRGDGREWLNVASAAAYMECSEERLRKLIARRALPYYSEGRGCRISLRRSEVDDYMLTLRQAAR